MTLRLPSFEWSWAKTAAKPAVSSSATGISASSSRLRARVISADPLAAFDFFQQLDRVGVRADRVAGHRVLAPFRQRFGLHRGGVAFGVELDPEGQFVGDAAVEGDAAGFVGAEEPGVAQAVGGAEDDRPDHDQQSEGAPRPV